MAKSKEPGGVYQLKITLKDVQPAVWRRVQLLDCSLADLHGGIQTAMGWDGDHLHEFEIARERYGEPDPDGMTECRDEAKTKLSQIVARGTKKFTYTYDFGDNWEHTIQVEKTLPPEPGVHYPRCIAGERACPPEDCGGARGYEDFQEAIRNPNHPEHEEVSDWIGGEFDPEKFDMAAVNKRLARK
jgi:hypothetical protein